MPEGTVMGHVHLHVGDLTPAEAFYHRALGLDKVVWSYPGALILPSQEEVDRVLGSLKAEGEPVTRKGTNEGGAAERSEGPMAVVQDPWFNSLRIRRDGG
ncbi:MAG: hypothetical protein WD960_09275 [Gemmatimonadota bacterium]